MKETFKFGPDVLVEIVSVVQEGLINERDISQLLRDIRVEKCEDDTSNLRLTKEYLKAHGRDRT